jgi:hypothetical protein
MKDNLHVLLFFLQVLISLLLLIKLNKKRGLSAKPLLIFLLLLSESVFSQPPPHTFNTSGPLAVPAGVTEMTVEAWGGGGAGGGASGSVVNGRAAAGGGGGAYAKGKIVVVPGTTLNVVVAQATPNVLNGTTAADGLSGGNSTIQNFETVILAVGGAGGHANNSIFTPNPLGGVGGSDIDSRGSLQKLAGGNGVDGRSGVVGLLLYSGAGGKGGSTLGGNGGASITSVALVNAPGNPGVAPGGGGSGAMNSISLFGVLGGPQIGGTGAAGQVIVDYICPTYNITTVTATAVCTTAGTSTITLTGSAASLPAGVYSVTYNLTNPVLNNATIAMTVTTPGTGEFTLSGLNTVGTRNIKITKLTSGACFTDITSSNINGNIITSAVTVGGVIGGSTAVCSGSATTLSLTGNVGSVLRWESSVSPFSTWIPVANTTTSYVSGPLTETTRFRAVVQSGGCLLGYSTVMSVAVNPLPQGSLTVNGPFCGTGSPQLTFTATQGTGPYTIIYKENGGADHTATGIVSGMPFVPFTNSISNSTTYTLVSVADVNTCIRPNGFAGGSASVTVIPKPTTPILGTIEQPTCITSTGSIVLNGLLAAANWTITQSNGTVNQTYSGSGTTFKVLNLAPGNYTFTIHENAGCLSLPTVNVQINAPITNIWRTTGWSKGSPPIFSDSIEFADNYTSIGDLSGCSCKVNGGKAVTIKSGHTLFIDNAVTVDPGLGTSLTFENNASLLQKNPDKNINSGNINYIRTTPVIRQADYVYWSTPVKGQTLVGVSQDLTLSDKYYIYGGTGVSWIGVPKTTVMTVGKGYIIRGPQNYSNTTGIPYTATFTGTPNNGTITTNEVFAAGKNFLIGNPYPSALDAETLILENSALEGTLYFWTHNTPVVLSGAYRYNANDYATYNLTGSTVTSTKAPTGDPANPNTNSSAPSGKIAAGQSFMAAFASSGQITFTNEMRVGGAENSQFFKPGKTSKSTAIEKHRIWLNFTNTEGAFKQLLVGYIQGATNSYESRYDGSTVDSNKYVDFYSLVDGNKLVIQGRALPFLDTDIVPLGYKSTIAGDFTISIDHTDGNLVNQAIYLEDKLTNSIYNLRTSDYTFTTGIGTFDERFILHYTNKSLGIIDVTDAEQAVLISVKNKIIKVTSTQENISEVTIFDIAGKLLFHRNKINALELQISNLQSSNQVLLVKTILENGNVTTAKTTF